MAHFLLPFQCVSIHLSIPIPSPPAAAPAAAQTNDAAKNDETSAVPPAITQALREMGAFGLQIPEAHGGVGLNNLGCVSSRGGGMRVRTARVQDCVRGLLDPCTLLVPPRNVPPSVSGRTLGDNSPAALLTERRGLAARPRSTGRLHGGA
jgi:hypothetical protein